jgi:Transposase
MCARAKIGDGQVASRLIYVALAVTCEGDAWSANVRWATLGLSGPYHAVFDTMLPDTTQIADAFHLVKLANSKLDECRRRVQEETFGYRGRKSDPPYRRCRERGGTSVYSPHEKDQKWRPSASRPVLFSSRGAGQAARRAPFGAAGLARDDLSASIKSCDRQYGTLRLCPFKPTYWRRK